MNAAEVDRTYHSSAPAWPVRPAPPQGAPNIIYIVLDDVGYSQFGCYGAEIATPSMDRLAADGLLYTKFHTTAMCSPSRASLLTGRNAHAVGVGMVPEMASGFPGYLGSTSKLAATLAEVLGEHGYSSYAVGKWHLTATTEISAAGPFDHWPLGRGFDRFYGFMAGLTDQFHPELVVDNHPVDAPTRPGYHLSEDLVDQSVQLLSDHRANRPGAPFFLYLCFGACHNPLQAPKEFIDRYRGRYDSGWDVLREERFACQQRLGLLPPDTVLAPRNPGIPAWEELSAEERRVCARLQEVMAGFLEHTDAQIGRLTGFLEETGALENTLVVLLSDNGAEKGGGRLGYVNSFRGGFSLQPETLEEKLAGLEAAGSEFSFPLYPAGWAQVANTPLKWYKTDTYAGGTRCPLIVHWPARIGSRGGIRTQYHHIVDVMPTVLEVLGIQAPAMYAGVPQLPIHGTSMAYTFDAADAPTRKVTQYYEILGDRALYHRGWTAVTMHTAGEDFDADHWELYHTEADFSECRDLSARHPEKLRELIERWWTEAGRYDVLPLDDRRWERHLGSGDPAARDWYEFRPGMARFEKAISPRVADRSHFIQADVEIPDGGAEGVLLASGGRFGGYVLYLRNGCPRYVYNFYGAERFVVGSEAPVAAGRHRVELRFTRKEPFNGIAQLFVDGRCVGSGAVRTMRASRPAEALYCGREGGSPVDTGYTPPFPFTGRIQRVVVQIDPSPDGSSSEAAWQADLRED